MLYYFLKTEQQKSASHYINPLIVAFYLVNTTETNHGPPREVYFQKGICYSQAAFLAEKGIKSINIVTFLCELLSGQ